jgi:hypothetical protein
MKKIIFFLVVFALMVNFIPSQANAEFSGLDKEFLKKQCQVSQDDVDVVLSLKKEVQDKITSWITAKDCEKIVPFKVSRNYYKQLLRLEPTAPIPQPPEGWHTDYLTDKEYDNYTSILADPKHFQDAFDAVFGTGGK